MGTMGWDLRIENYGKSKESWLKQNLQLPNGIPSHDTFNRFFSALGLNEFEQAFLSWIKDISELTDGEVVSIDGKTICGSREGDSKRAVHIVSAWSKANQLSLCQVKVDEKSNEITAVPKLLNVLVVKRCLVTIDVLSAGYRRQNNRKRSQLPFSRQRQSGLLGRGCGTHYLLYQAGIRMGRR
jgi:hypothetical protein